MDSQVVVEKGENSYGAYVPDLPRCVAVGELGEEVLQFSQEAIEFQLDGLQEDGLVVPPATSSAETVHLYA